MKTLLTIKHAMAFLATICVATGAYAQFTPGNLVVLQAGDGSTTLSNTGNAVVLKEFTPTGTPGYSMAIPTASATGLTVLGNSTAEGYLTRSTNGQQLIIAGYAGTYTSSIASATGTLVPRVIGTVDGAGTYTRVASSTSFFSAGNIRSAASDGNGNYWANGSNQGTNYFGNTTTPALIQNSVTNTRAISIQGGDLAFSTSSGTRGVYVINTIGSGTTTTLASTVTLVVPTGTTSSPYQFAIAPSLTYGYVADDNSIATGGGIQKWTFNGFTWSLAYTFATSTNTAVTSGARGLVVDFSGTNPIIYATTAESSSNRLISIVDGGSLATSTITTLATATTTNTIFRGVAFTPTISSCTTPTINVNTASICSGGSATLTASGATSYTWSPAATLNTTSGATVVANPTTTTTYTVMGATGTCTAMATTTVNVISTPTLAVTSVSICAGQTATIVASGASTYTWTSPASNNPTITVTPSATTVYTVSGNAGGCAGTFSATGTVSVSPSPTVTATSATVCAGKTASLIASGATSYTWMPGNVSGTTFTVVATGPSFNTYTVTGSTGACSRTASASVVGIPNPTVTASASSSVICAGSSVTLTATGATSYVWSNGVTNGTGFTPTTTATYTVTGTSAIGGCTNTAVSTVSVSPCTGIYENVNNAVFNVYPNPNNGNFTVQSSVFPATLVMYDVTGKQVIRKDITELETHVNVSQLNNGIYYISLIAESGSMNYKMVISK